MSGDTVTAEVTVTNDGDVAGKDVVQLYMTAPYTNGGIEKPHVQLIGFDKTDELAPGASETVTLEVPVEELASYDYQDAKAWVVEEGDYEFKLMANSHDVIDSEEHSFTETITYDDANKRDTDMIAATNQFDWAKGELEVLSRADDFANHDEALTPASDRELTPAEQDAVRVTLPTEAAATMPTTGANNGLSLADLKAADYDDPRWDQLLDQMTIDEMKNLIAMGGYQTEPVESIVKARTVDIDGPQGLSSFMGASAGPAPTPPTWCWRPPRIVELAQERGQLVGLGSPSNWVSTAGTPRA